MGVAHSEKTPKKKFAAKCLSRHLAHISGRLKMTRQQQQITKTICGIEHTQLTQELSKKFLCLLSVFNSTDSGKCDVLLIGCLV